MYKHLERIVINGVRVLLPSFTGFLVSFIIIRFYSKDIWGQIAVVLLYANLIIHIVSWGFSDYLIRKFSTDPGSMRDKWVEILNNKFLLFIPFAVFIGIYFKNQTTAILICSYVLLKIISGSYDPIIIHTKKYFLSILSELVYISTVILTICSFPKEEINETKLLLSLSIGELCRTSLLILVCKKNVFPAITFKIIFLNYKSAFSFFLLRFTGLTQSRIDQIFVNHYMNNAEKAFYQVLATLLLFSLSIPDIIVTPYLKNLYRSKIEVIRKITNRILLISIITIPLSIFSTEFILVKFYKFEFNNDLLLPCTLILFPSYYLVTKFYLLFRINKTNWVVLLSFIGTVINATACAMFVPAYGLYGALWSTAISQWGTFLVYLLLFNTKVTVSLSPKQGPEL